MKTNNLILLASIFLLNSCNSSDQQKQPEEKKEIPIGQIDTTNILIATICQNGKWGFIDSDLKPIIAPQFEKVYGMGFHEGLACVRVKDKWGFINLKGEFVIQPKFDDGGTFYEGLAMVGNMAGNGNGSIRHIFINTKGENVFNTQYRHALDFNNGSTQVEDANGKSFFMDLKGNEIHQPNKEIFDHFKYSKKPYGGQLTKSLQLDPKTGNPVGIKLDNTNCGYLDELGYPITEAIYCFAGEFRYSYKTPEKYLSMNAHDTIVEANSNFQTINATFKKSEVDESEDGGGTTLTFIQEDGNEIIFDGYNAKSSLIPITFCDPKSSKASIGRKFKIVYSVQNTEAEGGGIKELKILETYDRIK